MTNKLKSYKWFLDALSPHESHVHGIDSIVCEKQTRFQKVEILDTFSYGRCLVLDGKMQSSEVDEFVYHEALVHPAMLTHPDPKRVFIVGGGEGATLREVLRYPSVEMALMVDIDQEVVELSRQYLPTWSAGAFDDPRTALKYLDARRFLEETNETYDIIIIDISEPVEEGPAYLLYTKEFYALVMDRLSPDGLISLQAGTTSYNNLLNFGAVYQTLKQSFPIVSGYQAIIPSFGLPWGFAVASKRFDPRDVDPKEADRRIKERVPGELKYYDGGTHQSQFVLSKPVRREIEKQEQVIEDNQPLFTYN